MTRPGNVDVPSGAIPSGGTAKRRRMFTIESVMASIDVFSRRIFDWWARTRNAAKRQRVVSGESTDRSRSAVKRRRVAVVESALANIDVLSQLASFLEAKDLCQVKATCKALGSANGGAALNGLSMADEAVRRIYEDASDGEKAVLPRYEGESWIELYHHLLMLRGRLTFDQLVGRYVKYRGGDEACLQGVGFDRVGHFSHAICGNHVMRAGKHWATFTNSSGFPIYQTVCVVRPLPGWQKRGLNWFNPGARCFHQDLQQERTGRWEGDVHYCRINIMYGDCDWSVWTGECVRLSNWEGRDNYDSNCTILGMLLDLDEGTLSVYQNGRRLGTLKDGLAGEYCWTAGFWGKGDLSIQRGYNINTS